MGFKQRQTARLAQGGFKQDEINNYWGDAPPRSPTADGAAASSIVQQAGQDFVGPIKAAWSGLEDRQRDNWRHAFQPDTLDRMSMGATNVVRAGATLWDGLNAVFSPLVGAVNTVGAPVGRALGDAGVPAPHVTFDLKSPDSNILDPTQWTVQGQMLHGQAAGQEIGSVVTGLGALAVGSKPAVRASIAARSAAMSAFRSGEIRDPAAFPSALTRGQAGPIMQGQFPSNDEYGRAATAIAGDDRVAIPRVVKNMQDIWVSTGITPAEQVEIARGSPVIRQQLLAQDVNGNPVAPTLEQGAPPSARSTLMGSAAKAPLAQAAGETARSGPAQPTFVNSVDKAVSMMQDLEGSPDIGGKPQVSKTGAVGRMQIEPGTARQYGFDPARLGEPEYNAMVGRTIISDLYRKFDGNMEAMAIAYNDGPKRAQQWLHSGPGSRLEAVRDNSLRSGWRYERVPSARDETFMPMETQQYVARARFHMGGGEEPAPAEANANVRPGGASWSQDQLPHSIAEDEARAETSKDSSLSAASTWDTASFGDKVRGIQENVGTQPTTDVFPDYMKSNRFLADYISALTPFDKADKLLAKEGVIDPDKDFTTREAFQQINGADSRFSSFMLDGIVRHDNFNYTLEPGSPSFQDGLRLMADVDHGDPSINNRDAMVSVMLAKRTVNAATRDLDRARIELAKALDAQTKAQEPFLSGNFKLEDETSPEFKKAHDLKALTDARVAKAQAAFDGAVKKPGVDTGFNPFAAKALATDPKAALYDPAIESIQQTKAGLLQYAVDTGRLSQGAMDSMLFADPIHISMQRMGVDTKLAGFSKLGESDRKVVSDPLAADFANGQWIIRQADRNAATGHLINLASQNPTVMATLGLVKKAAPAEDMEAIDAMLKGFGYSEEQMDQAREAFGAVLQERMDERLNPNEFPHYVDGKREVWSVADPTLARSINSIKSKLESEAVIAAANVAADIERTAITVGPDWGWAFGAIHQGSQFIYDPMHPIPGVTILEGWTHMLAGDKFAKMARAAGGLNASMADLKGDYLEHLIHDLEATGGKTGLAAIGQHMKDLWADDGSVHYDQGIWNTLRYPAQFSRMITELIDEGNRVGLMAQGSRRGLSVAKAGARARRTGLDFQDKGASEIARLATRASPMYQGFLKGTQQWSSALSTPAKALKTVTFAGATLGTVVFANTLLNRWLDENDKSIPAASKWSEQPRYDKDRYIIGPYINGQRIKLRMPPGPVGFLFGGMLQRVVEWVADHNKHAFDGWVGDFLQENLRLPGSALVTPVQEAVTNHNYYTGHQLMPDSLKSLAPDRQYQPYTTETSKAIAKLIDTGIGNIDEANQGFSPMQLDHVIQGWTGPGGIALLKQLGPPGRRGPPTDVANIPGLSRLWERNPGVNAQSIQDWYADKQKFDSAFQERVLARKEQHGAAYAEWLGQHAGVDDMPVPQPEHAGMVDPQRYRDAVADAAYAKADIRLNKIAGMLGDQRNAIQSISDLNISDDHKRQLQQAVYVQMIKAVKGSSAEIAKFEEAQRARQAGS